MRRVILPDGREIEIFSQQEIRKGRGAFKHIPMERYTIKLNHMRNPIRNRNSECRKCHKRIDIFERDAYKNQCIDCYLK